MARKSYSSGSPWEDKVGYTRAVRVNNIIEVAGTVASKDGVVQSVGDAGGQTDVILAIVKNAIENLGGKLEDTVRTRVFCTNITDFEAIAKIHAEYFSTIKPVMSIVEISKLIHPDMLVEIEATAIIP